MAIPTVAAVTRAGSGGNVNTIGIAKPAGTVAGNLLLLAVRSRDYLLPATGWSYVGLVDWNNDGSSAFEVRLYWRIATSSEPASYTVGQNEVAAPIHAVMARITGNRSSVSPIRWTESDVRQDVDFWSVTRGPESTDDHLVVGIGMSNMDFSTDPGWNPNFTNFNQDWVAFWSMVSWKGYGNPTTVGMNHGNGHALNNHAGLHNVGWLIVVASDQPPTAPTVTSPNGGEEITSTSHTITWTAGSDPEGRPITYDIQLSLDGGTTWSTLYTGVSGTSKVHNFTQHPTTTTARIRIRARDEAGNYSPWDGSNANFTIYHNEPPTAPPLVYPINGFQFNRTQSQNFDWQFADPDAGDSQTRYEIEYRLTGAAAWTAVGIINSTATAHVFAANFFAAGTYEWRVRTYDSRGVVSPWSATGTFEAVTPPPGPTITDPITGSTISTQTYPVAWSHANQDSFQVRRVGDNGGVADTTVVYEDTGEVISANARNRQMNFPVNNRIEHVQVRTKKSSVWSPWDSVRVTVSHTPPDIATVFVGVGSEGDLQVYINNPEPSFLGYGPNKLTANESSFETSVADWGNASGSELPTRDTTWAADGVASLRWTSAGTRAEVAVRTSRITIPVIGGRTYRLTGVLRLVTAGMEGWVWIRWGDPAGTYITQIKGPTVVPLATGTETSFEAVAPANAGTAYVAFGFRSAANPTVIRPLGEAMQGDFVRFEEKLYAPKVISNEVYRRDSGDPGDGVRVAINVPANGTYVDWRVEHRKEYEYRALTQGDNNTSQLSEWAG